MSDSSNNLPNILLIVWDSCRYDYAKRHATTLSELAESNVSFEKAIAPSPWSMPSHGSIFSGVYPSEHGHHRADDTLQCPTAERLAELGYRTVGISANGFASPRTGFHESFDEFYYTGGRDLYPEGLNVSQMALTEGDSRSGSLHGVFEVLRSIPAHEHRLKSLANLIAVSCGEAAISSEALQRIPHRFFAPDSGYFYDSTENTARIEEVLQRDGGPYFVFVNYMNTHYPYRPAPDTQREYLGRKLSGRENRRVNEAVASPRRFLERCETGEIPERDIETVRQLYAGEVSDVDEELRKTIESLKRHDAFDDTLVVVTSDHGENLGEVDDMGRRRMGHEGSSSDAVLRVPLVLANPEFDDRTISELVSLKEVHPLLVDGLADLFDSRGRNLGALEPTTEPVMSHYPAVGGERLFEKHPEAPREALAYRISVDTVVGYSDEWKVVTSSNDERWARRGDEVVPYDLAPEDLRRRCESDLAELSDSNVSDYQYEGDVSQLEALGYM